MGDCRGPFAWESAERSAFFHASKSSMEEQARSDGITHHVAECAARPHEEVECGWADGTERRTGDLGNHGVERVRSHEEIECERTGAQRCQGNHPAKRPFSQASVAMPEKTSGAERLHYPPRSGVPFFKTR